MKHAFAGALFVFAIILSPAPAHAASATFFGPIVSPECHCSDQLAPDQSLIPTAASYGCVLQTVQNSINLLISISIIIFVLYLAYAGVTFMLSSASPGLREQGKTRIMNAVVGMVIILSAWLIVDFVMKTLYNKEGQFGPWNAILAGKSDGTDMCILAKEPVAITTGALEIVTGAAVVPGNSGAGGGGDRCATIPDSGLVKIDSSGNKLVPEAAQRFAKMKAAAAKNGVTITVNSAYRTPDEQADAFKGNGCRVVSGKAVCSKLTAAIPCSLNGPGSNHSTGVAIDVARGPGLTWVKANGAAYGFINALPGDPIHFSSSGR